MVVPILCLVFVGVVCLLVVFGYMIINSQQFGLKYLLTQQWRLFVFLCFYVYIYIFVFAFEIRLIQQQSDQYNAYRDMVLCKEVAAAVSIATGASDNCVLSQEVSYPLWFIVVFNASCQGVFVFLIFGTTKNVWWVS